MSWVDLCTYDRKALDLWFDTDRCTYYEWLSESQRHNTSPTTGFIVSSTKVRKNHELKYAINDFLQRNPNFQTHSLDSFVLEKLVRSRHSRMNAVMEDDFKTYEQTRLLEKEVFLTFVCGFDCFLR